MGNLNIVQDYTGGGEQHGYTDDGEWIWYWVLDDGGDFRFRDAGTPTDQPSEPPEEVREATEAWVERNLKVEV